MNTNGNSNACCVDSIVASFFWGWHEVVVVESLFLHIDPMICNADSLSAMVRFLSIASASAMPIAFNDCVVCDNPQGLPTLAWRVDQHWRQVLGRSPLNRYDLFSTGSPCTLVRGGSRWPINTWSVYWRPDQKVMKMNPTVLRKTPQSFYAKQSIMRLKVCETHGYSVSSNKRKSGLHTSITCRLRQNISITTRCQYIFSIMFQMRDRQVL